MVRLGKFKLELVHATTKTPFKEHEGKDGKTYAEVEPDVEYFIRVGSEDPRPICVAFYVDGNSLGYISSLSQHSEKNCGVWHCENDVSSFTALKFNKLVNRGRAPKEQELDSSTHWTGCIELKVYEKINLGLHEAPQNFTSTWNANTDQILKGMKVSSKKKALNSREGTNTTEATTQGREKFGKGTKISSMKLFYCSTVGLISAGVLAPPPPPDLSQLSATSDDSDVEEIPYKKRRVEPAAVITIR